MTESEKQLELEKVCCEVCLKEVPKSEATVPEAADYVAYFCGLDCYQRWKATHKNAENASLPKG